jgi:hemerythrin-like domain-containing protein
MSSLEPLRREHRELRPHIEALRRAADQVGDVPPDELDSLLEDSLTFLTHHLVPHARAEEATLYPMVDRAVGPGATATMWREHEEVLSLTRELAGLQEQLRAGTAPPDAVKDVRRVLYGLHTLVKVHFAEEEEVYLPVLEEQLTSGEVRDMLAAMHQAARG